ncbi:hypothetical protein [Bacillus sp. P14.5]|uniref:hypothetical protein n=1 Tax=Bacillus sp. P14.5 TaxID=1983400 RepID=UPI001F062112|nr:hypothetical protein [Bacillus sp. P14.5]
MEKPYLLWSETPYAGENRPPRDPVTPSAGTWPLIFLERQPNGDILTPQGRDIERALLHPAVIDFDRELKVVKRTLKNLTAEQKRLPCIMEAEFPQNNGHL